MTALLALVDEHREAIEYDCIRVGVRLARLGTPDCEWTEVKAVVKNALRDPHSELFHTLSPEDAGWGRLEQLLAAGVDVLNWLRWAQTKDGHRNVNHPKPIARPGIEKPEKIGDAPLPSDEMDAWLGWKSPELSA